MKNKTTNELIKLAITRDIERYRDQAEFAKGGAEAKEVNAAARAEYVQLVQWNTTAADQLEAWLKTANL